MNCIKCGNSVREGAKYCNHCGAQTGAQNIEQFQPLHSNQTSPFADVKCGQCGYVGPGEKARSTVAVIFAWIGTILTPLVPIVYFLVTHKWRCPKCKSTFIGVRNKYGIYDTHKDSHVVFVIFGIIFGIMMIGIFASIVLASLSGARERAREAAKIENPDTNYEVTESNISNDLRDLADNLNRDLPTYEENIIWEKVEVLEDNTLVFRYKATDLNHTDFSDYDINVFTQDLRSQMSKEYCNSEDFQMFRDNNIRIRQSYYDKDDIMIMSTDFSNKDC